MSEQTVQIILHTLEKRNRKYEIENFPGPLFPFYMISVILKDPNDPNASDEAQFSRRRPITCIHTRNLVDQKEINALNISTLDSVQQFTDHLTGYSYIIVNPTYDKDKKKVTFYCKCLQSCVPFECTVEDIE